MNWKRDYKTYIFVFNVGRGLAIFLRTPFNHGIRYDFGSSEDFSPNAFLKEKIIPHLDSKKRARHFQVPGTFIGWR